MQGIKHMTGFFEQLQSDKRLRPVHFSLCMALCCCWRSNKYQMPFRVTRKQLMALASISSTATYHKCIRDLSALGHIHYQPDYNYYKGTQVTLLNCLHHVGHSDNHSEPNNSGSENLPINDHDHPKIKRVRDEPRHKIRQVLRSFMPLDRPIKSG